MKTLTELLKESQKIKEKDIKKNGGYGMLNTPHLPEVLTLNKQYRKENPEKYGYNADIVDYIMKKENIAIELKDILESQIYFSQRDLEKEKQNEYEAKMLKEGWMKLTEEIIKKALENKKKIVLNASHTNDWITQKVEKILKPSCFNGQYGLMELKAKTRGYSLYQFENAFCKLV